MAPKLLISKLNKINKLIKVIYWYQKYYYESEL